MIHERSTGGDVRRARVGARRKASGLLIGLALMLVLAAPATGQAQSTLTPKGKQDRRAVVASLFASKARESDASLFTYRDGAFSEKRTRIPDLNFAIAARTIAELYRTDSGFDPLVASTAVRSGLESPCVEAECSGKEDLSDWGLPQGVIALGKGTGAQVIRCEGTCKDVFTPALKERYRRAVSQVGEAMTFATPLNSAQSLKDGLGEPDLEQAALALLDCAERNPLCMKAANDAFKGWMGAGFDATPAQLNETGFIKGETKTVSTEVGERTTVDGIELEPLVVKLDTTTGELKKRDGSPLDKAAMVAAVEAGFAKANAATAEGTADTKTLLEEKKVLQAKRDKLSQEEVDKFIKDASKREAMIKDAGKLVSLFAQAIELTGDKELAGQIETVGKAAVEIATGVNDLITGLVNVGASIATGNVVGAIVGGVGLITKGMGVAESINGLFGGRTAANAKPEDPVLKQVKALSKQMADLKVAMNSRFDRIEDGLDKVFSEMVGGFSEMAARFDQLDQNVDDVHGKLVKQSYRIDLLERNMRQLARTTEDRRLWERINTALGYRQRNPDRNAGLFPIDVFDGHASVFYTHAKPGGHAFDTVALGVDRGALGLPSGPTADEDVMSRLGPPNPAELRFLDPEDPASMLPAGSQLEENVNYLNSLAVNRFGGAAFTATLPNLRDWALAARAYARMLVEQPENAPTPPPGQSFDPRLAEIESVGAGVKQQLSAFARDGRLFGAILDNHLDRSKDRNQSGRGLFEELRLLESAFVERIGLSHASLYGAGRVAPPMDPISLGSCGGGREGDLSVPANVSWASMLEPQFLVAHKRGAGTARVCWEADFVDTRRGSCTIGGCESFGKLKVEVKGQWRSEGSTAYETLRTRSYTEPTERQICTKESMEYPKPHYEYVCTQASFEAQTEWDQGLKTAFERDATAGSDTPGMADRVLGVAREKLDEAQGGLRAELLSALPRRDDGSFSNAGLAVQRLDGAKVIIQSFVNLGLPAALERDERLRALLYGDDAILSRTLVEDEIIPNYRRNSDGSLFRDSNGDLVRDLTDRDEDPIERLRQQDEERVERLRESITAWQGKIAAGTHQETHPLIAGTLAELQMARLVAYSRSECSDGRDNDGDAKADHPADPDCQSRADDSERAVPPPANTARPTVTGIARAGQVLTAGKGAWSGAPTSFAYVWQRCDRVGAGCAAIARATAGTYRTTAGDVGRRLRVVVIARNSVGSAAAVSNLTALVAAVPPRNTALPRISGVARLGRVLTASPGRWSGTAPVRFRYSWIRCNSRGLRCTAVPRATARTYRLTRADRGRRLKVMVTARNAAGGAGALSRPTRVVTR